jgi:hypothetical protein
MIYLPGIIIVASLLTVIIVVIARGKSLLWRWLFALEILALFECFGNCFVPSSSLSPWKQFLQIEIPSILIAATAAITSSISRIRKECKVVGLPIWGTPQMISLYAVLFVVSILVCIGLS